MTSTKQDKLREQVHKLFGDHQADDGGYQSCYDGKWIDMTNEVCGVADFITADRKRVALGARIETVTYIDSMLRFENIPLRPVQVESLKQYLRQLEAQQEKL